MDTMTTPSSYTSPATRLALNNMLPLNDYKALICIFFFGAADSHQMVVPYNANSNRAIYEAARPTGVRIEQSELTSTILSGTSPQWALHPNLTHLYGRWGAGKLAIIRNVGTLNEPTTKANYLANIARYQPQALFAHNIQQNIWRAAVPFRAPRSTGWFGRTGDLIDNIFNPNMSIHSSVISTAGVELQCVPYNGSGHVLVPPTLMDAMDATATAPIPNNLRNSLSYLTETSKSPFSNPASRKNTIADAFRSLFVNGINQQSSVNTNLLTLDSQLSTIFDDARVAATGLPDLGLITQAETAIKSIVSRVTSPGFGVNRQMLFLSSGGWDNHATLRAIQDPKLSTVNIAIKAIHDCLTVLGLVDNVTIFTESEFSRTLKSNGSLGTDHAWAGHCFVTGGAVNGGMYGVEPNYTIGGPESDNSSVGRFIPSISTEQYYSTLLRWYGIPPSLLPLILPATDPTRLNPLPNSSLLFI